MTTTQDKAGQLRHRRNNPVKKADAETELVPQQPDESLESHDDGYILTPLAERSILMRLDVLPFLVGYAVLIYIDFNSSTTEENDGFRSILLAPLTLAFGSLLLCHAALVLLQQWSVPVKSIVGFKRGATVINSPTKEGAESMISSWTHCLVEEKKSSSFHQESGSSAKSAQTGADAGIAPVIIRSVVVQKSKQEYKVATVNFHDISFRCPTVPKSIDQDILLWDTSAKSSMQESNIPSAFSFHRVRFPINLPASFYEKWTGHKSMESILQCHHLYGANATFLDLPTFAELLFQQVLAPFFLFQIFCVALWSLDEYWYYAIFTLFALLSFESTVAYNHLKSLERLRSASRQNTQRLWVYRPGSPTQTRSASSWMKIPAQELVPGDLVSVTSEIEQTGSRYSSSKTVHHNTVPADLLLLKGNAVVDEALLTGESIPQIKVPFDPSTSPGNLQMQESKQSVLFGGTMLLSADNPATEKNAENEIPVAPDNGIVGVALQTGFETAQGSLLRTIAHSSKSVDGVHTWDTFVFIFLLICCAIASSILVLQHGWEDETRNRFRLVLHVIIIITSVVPPELPMELSLAVTNSVADLMKRCRVFCTEHYRIPWAGLVDVCCFDKTGTLTSDQMRLKGIRLFSDDGLEPLDEEGALVNPCDADSERLPWPTARIMAACHSLALRPTRGKSGPGGHLIGDPLEQAVLKDTGYELAGSNMLIPFRAEPSRPKSITILHRFAFASQLKRMTVIVTEEDSATSIGTQDLWALTKGAPETILSLLSKGSIPSDYERMYMHHMSRGRRVLAMGYRKLGGGKPIRALKEEGRNEIERNLTFAGFLVLDCPLKPDSKAIISEIRKSDHRVVMITGDAVLTAAEISKQVGIVSAARDDHKHTTYWLQEIGGQSSETTAQDPLSRFAFVPLMLTASVTSDSSESKLNVSQDMAKLQSMAAAGSASFCLTGDILVQVATAAVLGNRTSSNETSIMNQKSLLMHPKAQQVLKNLVTIVSVFARHAPNQKEAVVAAFNLSGHHTLYCGDGTNDLPSLKRAHVGVSILSAPDAESKQRKATASINRLKKSQKKGKKAPGGRSGQARSMEETMRLLREAQEEIDQVELGDASMASPFTSRQISIVCCKNVLQQGRCTLVTMLQIYKILGINCLVNAMVLSTLSIYGVKQGDRQLTVLGTVVAALFLFVTRAKPLETMSPARPPSSVLRPHVLLSIALQFAIHFSTILLACITALAFVDPYDPSIVADGPFNPNVLNTCTFLLTMLATVNTFAVNYRGRPFTEDLQDNKLMMRSLLACYASLFLCVFEAFPPLNDLLQLSPLPVLSEQEASVNTLVLPHNSWLSDLLQTFDFPSIMFVLMLADTALTFLVEKVIVRTVEG